VGTFLGIIASITEIFLKRRDKSFRREKLNMVTGLFFSEMGSGLLKCFVRIDPQIDILYQNLKVSNDWTNRDFHKARINLKEHSFSVDSRCGDLPVLREYLQNQANLLLRLLENPLLQERGNFVDLLRAIFHLRDELLNRAEPTKLIDSDRTHLEGDIIRLYKLLAFEWLTYMHYLKNTYGYLFFLAIRVNPFDPEATVVVRSSSS
jgi:hypothetical protein